MPDGAVKETVLDLPPGLVANPSVIPTECTPQQLFGGDDVGCPISSQVGVAKILMALGPGLSSPGAPEGFGFFPTTGVFKMVPPPGRPAMFAFKAGPGLPVYLSPSVRTGSDYGLTVTTPDVPQTGGVTGADVTLWGVPADPSHDSDRGTRDDSKDFLQQCSNDPDPSLCSNKAGYAPRAFMTNPGNCSAGPLATTLRARSWEDPGTVHTATFDRDTNGNPTAVTGCDHVPFEPAFAAQVTGAESDSPAGMEVDLSMPTVGLEDPGGLAQANVKRVTVTLPEGMSVSPSSADGLGACAPGEINLTGSLADRPAICPDSSKIGAVTIDTPLLEKPLEGSVYLARQNDNPFQSLLALYLVAEGPGVIVKLSGRVDADPATGRLSATFDNNPQLPFSRLRVRFKDGPRAPLATPPTCGIYAVSAEVSSWSAVDPNRPTAGEVVSLTDSVDIRSGPGGRPCAATPDALPFSPVLSAGTFLPMGGAFTPLALRVNREDGHQIMDGLTVKVPTGLLAKLRAWPCAASAKPATSWPLDYPLPAGSVRRRWQRGLAVTRSFFEVTCI